MSPVRVTDAQGVSAERPALGHAAVVLRRIDDRLQARAVANPGEHQREVPRGVEVVS